MIIVKTTTDKFNVLEKICKTLLQNNLIACANIIPDAFSYFYWENKLQKKKEFIIIIKTIKKNEKKVYDTIKKLHNYEVPEILSLQVTYIEKNYKKWAKGEIV